MSTIRIKTHNMKNIPKLQPLTAILMFCIASFAAHAQLYNYTNNVSGIPAYTDINTTFTNLARINGATMTSSCPDGFNSNKLNVAATFNTSRSAVEFSITPNVNYQLNVSSVSIDCRRNNKGPQKYRLAYSTNGGTTWQTNGTDYDLTLATACGSTTTFTWDMADFSTTGSLLVRVYCFKSVNTTTGILQLQNFILNGTTSELDNDGDGFNFSADCDDANPSINPSASEVCNGMDENCNTLIDDGITTTYYLDADSDGYGDITNATTSCSGTPTGYTSTAGDCDDASSSINPAIAEICNTVDDDCDGIADNGLEENIFFEDADADGLGSYDVYIYSCQPSVSGYTIIPGDCEDDNPLINLFADEILMNGIDDNCDGLIDSIEEYTFYESNTMMKSGHPEMTTNEVLVYPNPVTEYMQIEFTNNLTQPLLEITIISAQGRVLYSSQLRLQEGETGLILPVKNFCSKGMYYLKVSEGERTKVKTFIVE